MEEAATKAAIEEHRRKQSQLDLQDRYRLDLEREKMVTTVARVCLPLLCSFVLIMCVVMRQHVVFRKFREKTNGVWSTKTVSSIF